VAVEKELQTVLAVTVVGLVVQLPTALQTLVVVDVEDLVV
jgi:hypothetical protein